MGCSRHGKNEKFARIPCGNPEQIIQLRRSREKHLLQKTLIYVD
jgi:hypothetical protein